MNKMRMRGRGHRQGGGGGGGGGGPIRHHSSSGNIPLNRNHVFDSSGPDIRIRGTAQQLFEKYGERYRFDPLMLAAQGYQESELHQEKRGPSGAIGVMQILPTTASALKAKVSNKIVVSETPSRDRMVEKVIEYFHK